MKEYYIDLGSSTLKVYEYEENLKLIEEHSIYFKNDFDFRFNDIAKKSKILNKLFIVGK